MDLYTTLARPLLFRQDAETAHEHAAQWAKRAMGLPGGLAAARLLAPREDEALKATLFGREFAHPLGLAAGFDKDAETYPMFLAMGFSHAELGSVTVNPQPGNPRPRIFRKPEAEDIYNSSGFPGVGHEAFLANRKRNKRPAPLGLSLGKMKASTPEEAMAEYRTMARKMAEWFDYVVINLSSPNTPGLRSYQAPETIASFLAFIGELKREIDGITPVKPGWLVKISPNLADESLAEIARLAMEHSLDGIVATNTMPRQNLSFAAKQGAVTLPACGQSGQSLRERANATCKALYRASGGKLAIIGVGGISDADHAYERIRSGASLVQMYTGFVYRGPGVMRAVARGLAERLRRDGFASVGEAVGVDAH